MEQIDDEEFKIDITADGTIISTRKSIEFIPRIELEEFAAAGISAPLPDRLVVSQLPTEVGFLRR